MYRIKSQISQSQAMSKIKLEIMIDRQLDSSRWAMRFGETWSMHIRIVGVWTQAAISRKW